MKSRLRTVAGWASLIGGAALLVLAAREFAVSRGGVPKAGAPAPAPGVRPIAPAAAPDPAADPVARARELAAQGRCEEAVHVLLLGAIAALARGGRAAGGSSLTSREVLQAARVDDEARAALHRLVDGVERTLFGGRPADAAAVESCVAAYAVVDAAAAGGAR